MKKPFYLQIEKQELLNFLVPRLHEFGYNIVDVLLALEQGIVVNGIVAFSDGNLFIHVRRNQVYDMTDLINQLPAFKRVDILLSYLKSLDCCFYALFA